jgi:BMFP domain-containing protein YqiC
LFGKLSKLESEAENIRRENTEVENLYHESLNEIYNKIDKLKKENKTLTDIILSNSSNSPKQTRKFISSYEESIAKISEKEENKLDLVSQERAELESERFRIEKEISEIPASSKSLANKKKRQTLEKELADVMIRLENLLR